MAEVTRGFNPSEVATICVALDFFVRQRFDNPHLEASHLFDEASPLTNTEIERLSMRIWRAKCLK